jgi:hypothetical protein
MIGVPLLPSHSGQIGYSVLSALYNGHRVSSRQLPRHQREKMQTEWLVLWRLLCSGTSCSSHTGPNIEAC